MNDYVHLHCLDDYISFALSVLLIIPGGLRLIIHQPLGCDTYFHACALETSEIAPYWWWIDVQLITAVSSYQHVSVILLT